MPTTWFETDGRVYGPGSFVVSMAQPKQALVRWMLGRTFYPDNTYTRDRNPIRPYDTATDTFAEFMGVRVDPLHQSVTGDLVKLTAPVVEKGTVAPSGCAMARGRWFWLVSGRSTATRPTARSSGSSTR